MPSTCRSPTFLTHHGADRLHGTGEESEWAQPRACALGVVGHAGGMPSYAPDRPVTPAVHAPTSSRVAAAVIALVLVPVAWWLTAHGEWSDAGWLVPVLVVVTLVLNVLLGRRGVKAPGPMALSTMAVFAVAMTLFTTIFYFVGDDLVRVLIAAVPAVLIATFAGPGIQQGAADVDGEWIVAAGVAILALFVSMLLLKVQVSLHGIHDDDGPGPAKHPVSTSQDATP